MFGGGRHAIGVTLIVDQLLQALVTEGRSGLAEPPPRHDPAPLLAALEQELRIVEDLERRLRAVAVIAIDHDALARAATSATASSS